MKKQEQINFLLRREWERFQEKVNKNVVKFHEVNIFEDGSIELWTKKPDFWLARLLYWLFRTSDNPYTYKEHNFKNFCCYEAFCEANDIQVGYLQGNNIKVEDICQKQ
jgi:hypothetical protein